MNLVIVNTTFIIVFTNDCYYPEDILETYIIWDFVFVSEPVLVPPP